MSNDKLPKDADGAEQFIMEIDKAMIYPKPLKTELIEFEKFYPAEEYHQDYYKKSLDKKQRHYLSN